MMMEEMNRKRSKKGGRRKRRRKRRHQTMIQKVRLASSLVNTASASASGCRP
jgi:hypothetical protein